MNIRPFHIDDQAKVVELWHVCDLVRPQNDPERDIARKLEVHPELFLVAERDGEIIGSVMAGYEGHRGWINYLAVAPGQRRCGLGRQLMNEAIRRLHALGCPKVNLQVRRSNAEVVAFYKAIGFAVDNVTSLGKRLIPDN
ncbi:MAG: GNAT family acetyltransferase [Planctomycetota bacterium]